MILASFLAYVTANSTSKRIHQPQRYYLFDALHLLCQACVEDIPDGYSYRCLELYSYFETIGLNCTLNLWATNFHEFVSKVCQLGDYVSFSRHLCLVYN